MRLFFLIFFVFIFINTSYCSGWELNAFPFLRVDSKNVKPPVSLEDALNQLNFVLKTEIVEHFKNEDEALATIKISQELGGFFSTRWKLGNNNPYSRSLENPSELILSFSRSNMNNPVLMMRVVFSCFHKKLNNKDFFLNSEIEKVRKDYSISEYNVVTFEQHLAALSRIEAHEDSVVFAVILRRYSKNDTLGTRFYENMRESKFYISGIIDTIDAVNNLIELKVFDIVSDKRYRNVLFNNELIRNGDKLIINGSAWQRLNDFSFNYRDGTLSLSMPKWQNYLKRKYHEGKMYN